MNLESKKIINLMVETQSGERLGKIESFEVESESQSIIKYYVKLTNHKISKLLDKKLIIDRGQVISLTNQKMVVDDNLVPGAQKKDVLKQTSSAKAVAI